MLVALVPTVVAAAMMTAAFRVVSCSDYWCCIHAAIAWNASNIAGHTKKVTANALTFVVLALGSLTQSSFAHIMPANHISGNILGIQTFQAKQALGYIGGKISIMVTLLFTILVLVAMRICNRRLDKRNQETHAGMSEQRRGR